MLGGHLDSWHGGTGATDNAIGCSIMMEAARLIEALQLKPRRTVRVALWSGEEEGLLGSLAYVKAAFRDGRGSQARIVPNWTRISILIPGRAARAGPECSVRRKQRRHCAAFSDCSPIGVWAA